MSSRPPRTRRASSGTPGRSSWPTTPTSQLLTRPNHEPCWRACAPAPGRRRDQRPAPHSGSSAWPARCFSSGARTWPTSRCRGRSHGAGKSASSSHSGSAHAPAHDRRRTQKPRSWPSAAASRHWRSHSGPGSPSRPCFGHFVSRSSRCSAIRRTLLVTAVLVVFSAALTGWLPSLVLRRLTLTAAQGRPRGATSEGQRARGLLLAAQAMLSVTLLVGAGLFVRSLVAVRFSSLGYDPSRVLVVNRFIPPGGFDAVQQATLRGQLLQAASALPAVESAAWMSSAPFVSTSWTDVHVPGLPNATALGPFTFQATTADYFKTMGTRVVRGRGLRTDDTIGAPAVAVVSESMARTLWPGRDAIGECFGCARSMHRAAWSWESPRTSCSENWPRARGCTTTCRSISTRARSATAC